MFLFVCDLQGLILCWRWKENYRFGKLSTSLPLYVMFIISSWWISRFKTNFLSSLPQLGLTRWVFLLLCKICRREDLFWSTATTKMCLCIELFSQFVIFTVTSPQYSQVSIKLGVCVWDGGQSFSMCSACGDSKGLNSLSNQALFTHTLY